MKYKGILLLIILAGLASCSKSKTVLELAHATQTLEILDINDSLFFSHVTDIEIYKENIYIVDQKIGRIVKSNLALDEASVILETGDGPNEISGLLNVAIHNDLIYCLEFNKSIKIYDLEGNFIRELDHGAGIFSDFDVTDDFIWICGPLIWDSPITKVPLKEGLNFDYFGLRMNDRKRDGRHILKYGKNTVDVSLQLRPFINYYNEGDSLLQSLDLSELDVYKYSKVHMDNNEGLTLVWDATIKGQKLYMLLAYRNIDDQKKWEKILVSDIKDNSIIPSKLIQLKEKGFYVSFEVFQNTDQMILFDALSGSLDVYDY